MTIQPISSRLGSLVTASVRRSPLLWSRRHDTGAFGLVRLGVARMPSRSVIEVPKGGRAARELKLKPRELAKEFAVVGPVPVTARMTDEAQLAQIAREHGAKYEIFDLPLEDIFMEISRA